MKRFICTLFGLLAGMALLLPSLSWAKYPEKPITFICPYGAGGSTDIQARVLAGSLEKKLNQPIIVKNITGAGGLPGTQAAIDARPDGYTFGYIPLGPLVMQPHLRGLPSQVDQFAYVARIINAPYVLFVAANAPWNSVTRQTVLCTTPFSFGMKKLGKSILWHTVCIKQKGGCVPAFLFYAVFIRSAAILAYSGESSMPTHLLPVAFAARAVEPPPRKGSSTVPPSGTMPMSSAMSGIGLLVRWTFSALFTGYLKTPGRHWLVFR